MRCAACILLLLSAQLLAQAAPALVVPYGRIGQGGDLAGPAAVWRPAGGTPFLVQSWGEPAHLAGTVQRRELKGKLGGEPEPAPMPTWDAALLLGSAVRSIYTTDSSGATIVFDWASLDAAWRAALDAPAPGQPADGRGEQRSAFLRGERSGEGPFRRRTGILGETVHGVPLVVGAPAAFEQGAQYAAFRARHRQRGTVVYVGANDGMLHAFDSTSGHELFAYVPAALAGKLAALTDPAYTPQAYLDASAAQADVPVGGRWKSVLGSGMGMGARGLFTLDITDPLHFGGALWEFTDKDDAAVGHIRAAPVTARLGQLAYLVASSGINPARDDGSGALFALALDKAVGTPWQEGRNYFRIDTPAGDASAANALGPPALLVNRNGQAIHAYAGDLQGRLWRFDLARRSAHLLFTAQDGSGKPQPIVHAPAVVLAPGGGALVLFASGRLLEESDLLPAAARPQTMYAIHDRLQGQPKPVASRKELARRRLTGDKGFMVDGEPIDYFASEPKRGWYFDFPDARSHGERAAGSALAVGGGVMFSSVLFDPLTGAASTRLYVVDAVSGFAFNNDGLAAPGAVTGQHLSAGLLPPQLVASSAQADGRPGVTGNVTSVRTVTLLQAHGGAIHIRLRSAAGRIGWREVGNWQELHAKTKERR